MQRRLHEYESTHRVGTRIIGTRSTGSLKRLNWLPYAYFARALRRVGSRRAYLCCGNNCSMLATAYQIISPAGCPRRNIESAVCFFRYIYRANRLRGLYGQPAIGAPGGCGKWCASEAEPRHLVVIATGASRYIGAQVGDAIAKVVDTFKAEGHTRRTPTNFSWFHASRKC